MKRTAETSEAHSKKMKAIQVGPSDRSSAVIVASNAPPATKIVDQDPNADELIPRHVERLSLVVNPNCLKAMKEAGFLGFNRPVDQLTLAARFYEIDPAVIRRVIIGVLQFYLPMKLHNLGRFSANQATIHANAMSDLTADACMSAIYAKLRVIHRQYGTYSTRFPTPPTYTKEIELPLPYADAIQNLGVFETRCMPTNYLMVPVYKEGTLYEGRSNDQWHAYKYEAYLPILKECGIPFKSIDTRVKAGSAWWTLRPRIVHNSFDLECILPFLHYSDHSVITASLFLSTKMVNPGEPEPFLNFKDDDKCYGVRLREVPNGYQLRSFAALCHAPRDEWSSSAT